MAAGTRRSSLAGRARHAALALLLVLVSLAFVFAVGEGALRVAYGRAAPYFLWRIVRWDEGLGWSLVPGAYEFFNLASFTHVRIAINELGLRGAPRALHPEPPRRRLTVVGDSFVFSEGISEGELFTDRLQAHVGPDCEIVNAGVPGFGTGQQTLLVERLRANGFTLGGTVVLVFFTNDPSDNAGLAYDSLERDPRKPRFAVRGGKLVHEPTEPPPPVPTDAITAALTRESLFLALLRERVEVLFASQPGAVATLARLGARVPLPRPPGVIQAWYAPGWEERWARTREILRYFAQLVRSNGSKLLVAFMPSPFQTEEVFQTIVRSHAEEPLHAAFLADLDRPQGALLDFCGEEGLRCIDLTPALRRPRDGPAFFLREGHLNALGSEIVAEALHDALVDGC